jgi:hypothetical protein
MTYYVYFDSYGHAKAAVSERELAEKYGNDPNRFLKTMCGLAWHAGIERTSGHVGTMTFESKKELKDYLAAWGDALAGFYECESDSRPYNF